MNRRDFLKSAGLGGANLALVVSTACGRPSSDPDFLAVVLHRE